MFVSRSRTGLSCTSPGSGPDVHAPCGRTSPQVTPAVTESRVATTTRRTLLRCTGAQATDTERDGHSRGYRPAGDGGYVQAHISQERGRPRPAGVRVTRARAR